MTEPVDPTQTMPSAPPEPRSGDPEEAYCPACSQSFGAEVTICPNDGARLVRSLRATTI
jgi:hypothetical protein